MHTFLANFSSFHPSALLYQRFEANFIVRSGFPGVGKQLKSRMYDLPGTNIA